MAPQIRRSAFIVAPSSLRRIQALPLRLQRSSPRHCHIGSQPVLYRDGRKAVSTPRPVNDNHIDRLGHPRMLPCCCSLRHRRLRLPRVPADPLPQQITPSPGRVQHHARGCLYAGDCNPGHLQAAVQRLRTGRPPDQGPGSRDPSPRQRRAGAPPRLVRPRRRQHQPPASLRRHGPAAQDPRSPQRPAPRALRRRQRRLS